MGVFLTVLFWMSQVFAAEVTVETSELYEGQPFQMAVYVKGLEPTPDPKVQPFDIPGFSVSFEKMQTNDASYVSRSFVNGRYQIQEEIYRTFEFLYKVVPQESGSKQPAQRLMIPSIAVKQGDVIARSRPEIKRIKVIQKTSSLGMALSLPERTFWAGETVPFTLHIYAPAQKDIFGRTMSPLREIQRLTLPFSESANKVRIQPDAVSQSDKKILVQTPQGELPFSVSQSIGTYKAKNSVHYQLKGKLTFLKPGPFVTDGVELVALMRTRRGQRLYKAESESINVTVAALPLSGRPNTFTGALGKSFSIAVNANKTKVQLGEPVPISIQIKGKGELSGLSLPSFEEMGLDPDDFDLPTEKPIGQIQEDGSKLFESVIQVKSQAVRELPALSFSYFDAHTKRYVTATSQPIALFVEGSALVTANSVVSPAAQQAAGGQDIQSISLSGADLSLGPLGAAAPQAWTLKDVFPIALGFYGFPFLVGLFTFYRRKTESNRQDKNDRNTAKKTLKKAIADAKSQSAKDSGAALCQALRQWALVSGSNQQGLIADIEAAAYAPNAASIPLSGALINRCQAAIGKSNSVAVSQVVVIFCLIAAGFNSLPAQATDENDSRSKYEEALKISDRAERIRAFERVARAFENEVNTSPQSPDLLADWGNAAIGSADLGTASLAYRRALSIDPLHERSRRNLNWVEKQLPDWASVSASESPLAGLLFWSAWFNGPMLLLLSGLAFSIGGLLFIFYWRKNRIVVGLFALLWLSFIGSYVAHVSTPTMAVVQTDAGPLRSADNNGAPPVTKEWLPAGAAVYLLRQNELWSEVSLQNGQRGWLPNRAVILVSGNET